MRLRTKNFFDDVFGPSEKEANSKNIEGIKKKSDYRTERQNSMETDYTLKFNFPRTD